MTRKNWALAIILIVLIAVFGVLVGRKGPTSSLQIEKSLFAVADTAALDLIVLRQPDGAVQRLERRQGHWQLNEHYAADPSMMRLLLSVLRQVQVRRPVARSQQEEVLSQLEQQGVEVELQGDPNQRFLVGGREAERISYFARNGQAYVMELPGYASYFSSIFFLKQTDLRNKMLATLNSMNFQALDVAYPADTSQNVRIRFRNNMLGVEDIVRPDSSVLFQYMMIYEPLEVAGYLAPGEDPLYDSLLQTPPLAHFHMRTVGNSEGMRLHLYPQLPGRRYRLGYLPRQKEAVLLDERLAQAMLIRRRDLLLE
ncbi:hypothetical protein [Cesiribacter andamanensis]|uniref:DUF4340 domain-containing protein n=1 Tax=Cesiribacter andamanensis AMV16 TaxID=1279009 RepID=M7N8L8_9BACT|nr:hypothetical protein [Cesiribacter andamanensis]EMR03561.1 hypothetical protein ADICEAN_01328 [Cesiribacter andamanensis AMV16]